MQGRGQVLIRTRREDGAIVVEIGDQGPGIPPELVSRIFDPFFTTKEPGKGTGLGLAIVARTVDNFGGIVWVERAREGGAALHLFLPLAPATMIPGVEPADAAREAWRA